MVVFKVRSSSVWASGQKSLQVRTDLWWYKGRNLGGDKLNENALAAEFAG